MKKETKIDLMEFDESSGPAKESLVPAAGTDVPQPKKGKKKLLIIGLAGLLGLAAGVGAGGYFGYLPLGLSQEKKVQPAPVKHEEMGPTVKLSPLIINLKEENGRHYIKATIVLEIGRKEWAEEVQKKMSFLTDMVILTLSDKRLEDLRRPEAKEDVKRELLARFNPSQDAKKIKQIYFDEFLYQ